MAYRMVSDTSNIVDNNDAYFFVLQFAMQLPEKKKWKPQTISKVQVVLSQRIGDIKRQAV